MKAKPTKPQVEVINDQDAGNSPREIEIVQVGSKTFAYSTSEFDDSVHIFRVKTDGSLDKVTSISDSETTAIDQASGLASAKIGSSHYLFVTGTQDDGVSSFKIRGDGTLLPRDTVYDDDADDDDLRLDGVNDGLDAFTKGNKTFLVATGASETGLQMFQVKGNGTLVPTDDVSTRDTDGEASSYRLFGLRDVAHMSVANKDYVFATGSSGITTFKIDREGQFEFIAHTQDTTGLALQGSETITTGQVGSRSFVFAGGGDNGISVFEVFAGGTMSNVANVLDSNREVLDSLQDLEFFQVGDHSYLATTDENNDLLAIYKVGKTGTLSEVEVFNDIAEATLDRANGLDVVTLPNGKTVILASGEAFNGGITSFDFDIGDTGGGSFRAILGSAKKDTLSGTKDADWLFGKAGADTLKAGKGADRVDGGKGSDKLTGGQGKDEFIFGKDFGKDKILDFDAAGDDQVLLMRGIGEAETKQQFLNALSRKGGDVVYDFKGDGQNTITFKDTKLRDFAKNDVDFFDELGGFLF